MKEIYFNAHIACYFHFLQFNINLFSEWRFPLKPNCLFMEVSFPVKLNMDVSKYYCSSRFPRPHHQDFIGLQPSCSSHNITVLYLQVKYSTYSRINSIVGLIQACTKQILRIAAKQQEPNNRKVFPPMLSQTASSNTDSTWKKCFWSNLATMLQLTAFYLFNIFLLIIFPNPFC